MKRILSVLLSLCLMAACVPAAFAEDADVLHGYVSTWDNYGLSKDPITLTIGVGAQDVPVSAENNLELELIYQATGIRLEWVAYDTEKFAVLTAGGDLPDLFSMENSDMAAELIDSGAMLDIAPYIDQYGKNIQQVHESYALTWAKNLYGEGEHIYFLPSSTVYVGDVKIPQERGNYNYYVRWDIYQAIGAPAITDENGFNEDMFLDVLKQMQDYAREKTGKDSIYALSGWNDWGTVWAAVLPYGMGVSHKLNYWEDDVSGLVENGDFYGDADSHYYNALRFYNKAWRMGILDPEIFTLTYNQYDAKCKTGDVLVSNHGWYKHADFDQSVIDIFGDGVECYLIKGMPYFYQLVTQNSPGGYGVFASDCISSKCEYPERAVALLDYLRSDEFMRATCCGLQGVHWDYDETGKPVYIGDAAVAYENNTMGEFWDVGNGNFKKFPNHKWSLSVKMCADGYPSDFTASADYTAEKDAADANVQAYLAFYGSQARYPGEMYLEWVDEGIASLGAPFNPKTAFKPARTDEINSLKSKCETYFNDNTPKVVFANTAEEAEAAIAKMVEDEQAMGSAKLLEDALAREAESAKIAEELGF